MFQDLAGAAQVETKTFMQPNRWHRLASLLKGSLGSVLPWQNSTAPRVLETHRILSISRFLISLLNMQKALKLDKFHTYFLVPSFSRFSYDVLLFLVFLCLSYSSLQILRISYFVPAFFRLVLCLVFLLMYSFSFLSLSSRCPFLHPFVFPFLVSFTSAFFE